MAGPQNEILEAALNSWPLWGSEVVCRPQIIKRLNSGRSHSSYLLECESQKGVIQLSLRLDNSKARSLAMPIEQEILLLQLTGDLSPGFIYSDETLIVRRYINKPEWQPPKFIPQLAQATARLHALDIQLPQFDLLTHCQNYWHRLPTQYRVQHQMFAKHMLQHLKRSLQRFPLCCLCHNDLIVENILVDEQGIVFIDWEYASLNNPLFDLATIVEFSGINQTQVSELLACYSTETSIPTSELFAGVAAFQIVVRLVEWLWLSHMVPEDARHVQQRIEQQFDSLDSKP